MLIKEWNKDRRNRDLEDVLIAAAHDTDVEDVIHKGEQTDKTSKMNNLYNSLHIRSFSEPCLI